MLRVLLRWQPAESAHRRLTTGFFFCIFTRLGALTICSCNYFSFKTIFIYPQSTLVYGLLYRQGRKRGVIVLLVSWDSPHLKLPYPLPLFQSWRLCKKSHPLPSSKISITARNSLMLNFFPSSFSPYCAFKGIISEELYLKFHHVH